MNSFTSGRIRQVSPRKTPIPVAQRLVLAEQVLEHRRVRARRVRALRDLRELVRVAEQDDVPRRRPDREHVRERDLPRLVDEQRVHVPVELLAREQERRAREQLQLLVEHVVVRARAVDELVLVLGLRVAARLLPALEREALLERRAANVAPGTCGSPCGSAR